MLSQFDSFMELSDEQGVLTLAYYKQTYVVFIETLIHNKVITKVIFFDKQLLGSKLLFAEHYINTEHFYYAKLVQYIDSKPYYAREFLRGALMSTWVVSNQNITKLHDYFLLRKIILDKVIHFRWLSICNRFTLDFLRASYICRKFGVVIHPLNF